MHSGNHYQRSRADVVTVLDYVVCKPLEVVCMRSYKGPVMQDSENRACYKHDLMGGALQGSDEEKAGRNVDNKGHGQR